jgi:hypothetical protein
MFAIRPKAPRCFNCASPMQLIRHTPRYDELPDLYSFNCLACDEWHVEEGYPAFTQQRRPEVAT